MSKFRKKLDNIWNTTANIFGYAFFVLAVLIVFLWIATPVYLIWRAF